MLVNLVNNIFGFFIDVLFLSKMGILWIIFFLIFLGVNKKDCGYLEIYCFLLRTNY